MNPLFKDKRIFLVGGSGGVGKTTVAASLGLQMAQAGYKTVVLTVDPARRLANAFGFSSFTSELQPVKISGETETHLWASMLDAQHYFDKVISNFALSEKQKDKILSNRLYRIMVENLGGSHEYAAMERLLEFAKDAKFEKIIVDTPPSQNAVDLFNAPQKLADFMDSSVLKWFQSQKTSYFSVFKQGTKLAMKFLEKIFGSEFFAALAEALDNLEGMEAGFKTRNLEVLKLLKDDTTGFFLVSTPSEIRYKESLEFLRVLKTNQISLSALILNRLENAPPNTALENLNLNAEQKLGLENTLNFYRSIHSEQSLWIEKFKGTLTDTPCYQIERQNSEIHDLNSLTEIGHSIML